MIFVAAFDVCTDLGVDQINISVIGSVARLFVIAYVSNLIKCVDDHCSPSNHCPSNNPKQCLCYHPM